MESYWETFWYGFWMTFIFYNNNNNDLDSFPVFMVVEWWKDNKMEEIQLENELYKNDYYYNKYKFRDHYWLAITLIITLLTIIGNIRWKIIQNLFKTCNVCISSVISSVLMDRKVLKQFPNRFILSLSVADLSLAVFVMIPSVVTSQSDHWWLGVTLCQVNILVVTGDFWAW